MSQPPSRPVITFHRMIPEGLPPQRATRSAGGTLPTRGFRFCDPVTTASAFGWYVFLPMEFSVVWDGVEAIWSYDGGEHWYPLASSAQYPRFAQSFDDAAPEAAKGFSPPFLSMNDSHGFMQVWTGVVARTEPGWSVLVRAPANLPRGLGYEAMEGVIETDRWFGPLFTNVRLMRTDAPIRFRADQPFLQIQPLQRSNYAEQILNAYEVTDGLPALSPQDWAAFQHTVVRPNIDPDRKKGAYAVDARKRRAAEER